MVRDLLKFIKLINNPFGDGDVSWKGRLEENFYKKNIGEKEEYVEGYTQDYLWKNVLGNGYDYNEKG